MIAKQFEQGSVASREQGEKVVGKLFSERLLSTFRPNRVVIAFWALSELGQSIHSGDIAIRSTERSSTALIQSARVRVATVLAGGARGRCVCGRCHPAVVASGC